MWDRQTEKHKKPKRQNSYACCIITKKGQENPVKGQNCGALPLILPSLGQLEC